MAKFICALNQTLDGYIDHDAPGIVPSPALFEHFTDEVRNTAGSLYGRIMYEVMRYWDTDQDAWGEAEKEYANVWRAQHKWVVSTTLDEVGPNATLIKQDVEAAARRIKDKIDGQIEVAGPTLAASLMPLIDEYQIYLHPVVVGRGKPFFKEARPPLKLAGTEQFDGGVLRLRYVPA
ncbi:MAG TPA: dihydrofolate reductase family protein [Sphingomicrobium sp.]